MFGRKRIAELEKRIDELDIEHKRTQRQLKDLRDRMVETNILGWGYGGLVPIVDIAELNQATEALAKELGYEIVKMPERLEVKEISDTE